MFGGISPCNDIYFSFGIYYITFFGFDCFSLNILKTTCRWGGGWMYGPPGHNLTATMSCENCLLIDDVLLSFLYSFRTPFITIPNCGPTRTNSIVREGRHCLIIKRQNYPPTGAHHSLRFASLWRSSAKLNRSSSTKPPVHCTPWSLTELEKISRITWVVKPGRIWLAKGLRCRNVVAGKVSI